MSTAFLPLGILIVAAAGALLLAAFSGGMAFAPGTLRRTRLEAATCSIASLGVALVAGVAALQVLK